MEIPCSSAISPWDCYWNFVLLRVEDFDSVRLSTNSDHTFHCFLTCLMFLATGRQTRFRNLKIQWCWKFKVEAGTVGPLSRLGTPLKREANNIQVRSTIVLVFF